MTQTVAIGEIFEAIAQGFTGLQGKVRHLVEILGETRKISTLTRADLEAIDRTVQEFEGLAVYCGEQAGTLNEAVELLGRGVCPLCAQMLPGQGGEVH